MKKAKAKLLQVKSRRYRCVVTISIEGIFGCPRTGQRMDPIVCMARQGKRKRGCVTCRLPQQIERRKNHG